jgi:hypothetical protein
MLANDARRTEHVRIADQKPAQLVPECIIRNLIIIHNRIALPFARPFSMRLLNGVG